MNGDKDDERQRSDQDECQHGVKRQGDDDAADGQNRRAYAKALDAAEHVVDVVGVRRQAGNERGLGCCVRLRGGKVHDAREQVVADAPGRIAGYGAGHAVGDDVHDKRAHGTQDHRQAVEVNHADVAGGDDAVDDVRQNPRQEQVHDGAEEFNDKSQRHARVIGAQVVKNDFFHR